MDQATKDRGNLADSTTSVLVEDELKSSFLDYAMSVVVSRAIPDVRDGLKPVHRRILFTMYQLGYFHNKPYHKSVRIVGDVLGKYHPHGDQALYGTMVGMVQDFSRRYPLLDGQGNWGSLDGDSAAAMRYTEVRMQKISQELLADLDKETVPFVPNFDETRQEPTVLPSRIPNLLVNGTSGIAVGMATFVPPHNLTEVIDACLLILKDKNVTDQEIFDLVPAPDFPTGATICGRQGAINAYKTGRGSVTVRAVTNIEEGPKCRAIVITELPYQVNKADLIVKIADLVKANVITGISNIRDESDRRGIRVVIELKRHEDPELILKQLYRHTQLQSNFSILMLALLGNRPVLFTLRRLLDEFIRHRREVIYKRTIFDLSKAKARAHILHGLVIVLNNLDEAVQLIKASGSVEEALSKLMERFELSREQGKAVLEMKLQKLTGLEQEGIRKELEGIKLAVTDLSEVISSDQRLTAEVTEELTEIRDRYGDQRRSKIGAPVDFMEDADLIPVEDTVVTLTKKGYVKRVTLDTYTVQKRGGRGKMGVVSGGEIPDVVMNAFVASTHDAVYFFTNLGRVYSLKAYQIPETSRTARGRAIVNILPLMDGEHVVRALSIGAKEKGNFVMTTKFGLVKRTRAELFAKIRCSGIRAITLRDGDELAFCGLSAGGSTIAMASANGMGIRFKEHEVREMGRQAAGVKGMRLRAGDYIIGTELANGGGDLLFATENGYGKRVGLFQFRISHRGGLGVLTIPTKGRNGKVIGLGLIKDESQILLIADDGKIIRMLPKDIRVMRRQAKGLRLIRMDKDRRLVSMVVFDIEDEESNSSDGGGDGETPPQKEPAAKESTKTEVAVASSETASGIESSGETPFGGASFADGEAGGITAHISSPEVAKPVMIETGASGDQSSRAVRSDVFKSLPQEKLLQEESPRPGAQEKERDKLADAAETDRSGQETFLFSGSRQEKIADETDPESISDEDIVSF